MSAQNPSLRVRLVFLSFSSAESFNSSEDTDDAEDEEGFGE